MRTYEIMLILPGDADDAVVEGVVERITTVLAGRGGELGKVDRWGRRRLAYELKHHTDGYYVVAQFTASSEALKELDRVLSLADEVIRFKVVVRPAA